MKLRVVSFYPVLLLFCIYIYIHNHTRVKNYCCNSLKIFTKQSRNKYENINSISFLLCHKGFTREILWSSDCDWCDNLLIFIIVVNEKIRAKKKKNVKKEIEKGRKIWYYSKLIINRFWRAGLNSLPSQWFYHYWHHKSSILQDNTKYAKVSLVLYWARNRFSIENIKRDMSEITR